MPRGPLFMAAVKRRPQPFQARGEQVLNVQQEVETEERIIGLRVECRRHLQSVCLQDVVSVDQTDEKSGWSVLQHPPYSPDLALSDFHLTTKMTMR
ncbi:hypothetical protein AVEN_113831-1 [Araneus ventricosus]|uniref:Tc1-like transposase DDE domain-containing protein n=1 Tax=Araneus ventricosus TaxID=182803 RepID=A0A4Y2KVY2_ARAVE|nr:hypothetical protein AVEN_113831-1 [Araneus ventricosus]